jgi:hypothetical protein
MSFTMLRVYVQKPRLDIISHHLQTQTPWSNTSQFAEEHLASHSQPELAVNWRLHSPQQTGK